MGFRSSMRTRLRKKVKKLRHKDLNLSALKKIIAIQTQLINPILVNFSWSFDPEHSLIFRNRHMSCAISHAELMALDLSVLKQFSLMLRRQPNGLRTSGRPLMDNNGNIFNGQQVGEISGRTNVEDYFEAVRGRREHYMQQWQGVSARIAHEEQLQPQQSPSFMSHFDYSAERQDGPDIQYGKDSERDDLGLATDPEEAVMGKLSEDSDRRH